MAAPPPPPRGLSLYENLHDPNDPSPSTTISSGPVLYSQTSTTSVSAAGPLHKKPIDPALRFQPTRRPLPPKPKPKPAVSRSIPKPPAAAPTQPLPPPPPSSDTAVAAADPGSAAPASKSTLADWAATEDDEWLYGTGEKRPRGGRKAKKKRQAQQQQRETDWDDVYDASRPTNVEEYLRSDEKIDEVREWKALLYGHRRVKAPDSDGSSDEEGERPGMRPTNQFAPPPSYAAVPPLPSSPPTTSAPSPPPDDASGNDAYARRLALSSTSSSQTPLPSSSTTISAAPILYTQQQQQPSSPPPPPRSPSSRPGQAGFAHRLMAKYGWTSGRGLGAASSGIVNPLRVQVEKRRKKADADGGGWAEPANKGKIIGGGHGGNDDQQQGLSNVIVLLNMLDNMPDLAAEVENGLGQEIGEECGEKYGRVERVYIDTETQRVFIKFTDQISALKASAPSMVYIMSNANMVQAVSELQGRVFNGNTITPKYYNDDAFDRGVYTK
ncbi:Splicing factor 45 [Beauveria asiatica]|uniref:Splicing factor 45 n=1 Tax=Beauveria asiatica TaxID=1069075 RepID=A0AAW0RZ12_9HYPO